MRQVGWKGLVLVIAALAILVTVFAPSGVADERRVVVRVDEPFEMNGRTYPAGEVTLKAVRAYNPSSLLSEVWVGRECLGVFPASRISQDAPAVGDSVTFKRAADGHLMLVGFASADSGGPGEYRFRLQARAVTPARDVVER
jgi:hypothetical protein